MMRTARVALLAALALPTTPALAQQNQQMDEALEISRMLFAAPEGVDAAYGAYQRGYYLTALELAMPRAEDGDAAAQTLIAEIYANGLGVGRDMPTAIAWYTKAHENGDIQASFQLATIYQVGDGVARDRVKAAELFKAAAEGGHIAAKYNLGLLHIEGEYVEPNVTHAAELIGEAADAGYPDAQYDFAVMLLEGAGVAPDTARAMGLLTQAAEEGHVAAQIELATAYYTGAAGERDVEAAADWYRSAAGLGNPVAQARYAIMLLAGEGVSRANPEEAAMWRALARSQGHSLPQLERMVAGISPEVIAAGEERARFWPGRPPTSSSVLTPPSFEDPASDADAAEAGAERT